MRSDEERPEAGSRARLDFALWEHDLAGRLFDQTNGMVPQPEARPYERSRMWFGSFGGALGTNGR